MDGKCLNSIKKPLFINTHDDTEKGQCCINEQNCSLFLAQEFGMRPGGRAGEIFEKCKRKVENIGVEKLPSCDSIKATVIAPGFQGKIVPDEVKPASGEQFSNLERFTLF